MRFVAEQVAGLAVEGGLALHKMSWMERFFWSWIWLACLRIEFELIHPPHLAD